MMNCQAPRRPYRVSQMTTIFITLLCFPSFLGACVCVTYTMWRYTHTQLIISKSQIKAQSPVQTVMWSPCSIKPSASCGPFQGLPNMFHAGKRFMEDLEKNDPKLSLLAWAHTYIVEHPFFLFVGAGIFL